MNRHKNSLASINICDRIFVAQQKRLIIERVKQEINLQASKYF